HFLPLQVYEPLRTEGKISWPLVVVLTDFDAHVLWAQFTGDRFFVPSDEVADVLADKGIERGKISTAGIPILPAFGRDYDRAAIRAGLGLREGLPTLLVMGGAFGQGGLTDTVAMALQTACVQVLAVAGKNEKARHELETLKPPAGSTLRVFGYVNNIPELMAASDLVISKSGGLTLAECLAMGLPMLVPDPVPGQEERNCKYAIECGAAMCGDTRHSLRYKLKLMLETPGLLARMAAAARAHGRPNAARDILRSALEMAGAPHTFTRTPGVNTGTLKVS
ncbi:MAG: glycosyltransferase, partial [Planctomycetes bacterium]|nr:glycosyltransferase [Planctomycetota bacterium]